METMALHHTGKSLALGKTRYADRIADSKCRHVDSSANFHSLGSCKLADSLVARALRVAEHRFADILRLARPHADLDRGIAVLPFGHLDLGHRHRSDIQNSTCVGTTIIRENADHILFSCEDEFHV